MVAAGSGAKHRPEGVIARAGRIGAGVVRGSRSGAGTGSRIGSTTIFLSGFPISMAGDLIIRPRRVPAGGHVRAGRRTRS
jgi:hypothetical protein